MLERKDNYFKTGLIHFMAFPQVQTDESVIIDTVKYIASDPYFEAIEITTINSKEIRQRVKEILDISGMKVALCGQVSQLKNENSINHVDEKKRLETVNLLKQAIDQAYEVNADSFSFMSGPYELSQQEQAYQALVKSTLELCGYAKQRGEIKVALEVFDYDIDKKSLIGPSDLAKRFAQEIRETYPSFGLIIDLSHIPLVKETNQYCIETLKNYITHIHIGNCVLKDENLPGYGDSHPRFGFPGGENDIIELTSFLKQLLIESLLDGSIIVSFEIKPFGNEDPEVIIANSKRKLDAAWRNLQVEL